MKNQLIAGITLAVLGAVSITFGWFLHDRTWKWSLLLGGLIALFLASYLIDGFRKSAIPLWSFALWAAIIVASFWIDLLTSPTKEVFYSSIAWLWAAMIVVGAIKKLRAVKAPN